MEDELDYVPDSDSLFDDEDDEVQASQPEEVIDENTGTEPKQENTEPEEELEDDTNPEEKVIDYDDLDRAAEDENEDGNADEKNLDGLDVDESLTPMEIMLSKYNIEGGMIPLDDGTEVNIKDLKPSRQVEVLNSLREQEIAGMKEAIVNEFGLSPEEINIINLGREEGSSIEKVIEDMAASRAENLLAQRDSTNTDYDSMDNRAIYLKYLREDNPEATGEELETMLEEVAGLSQFDKIVKPLREQYKGMQDKDRQLEIEAEQREEYEALEADRERIVQSAQEIPDILGVPLSNDDKNEVLAELLEVNDRGDSLFMERVFSDPETLFKVAWLEKYGEKMSADKDAYWKKQVSAAYAKGKKSVLDGLPSTSVNARSNRTNDTTTQKKKTSTRKYKTQDELGWDD